MKPPYEINTTILKQISQISEKIGMINATYKLNEIEYQLFWIGSQVFLFSLKRN